MVVGGVCTIIITMLQRFFNNVNYAFISGRIVQRNLCLCSRFLYANFMICSSSGVLFRRAEFSIKISPTLTILWISHNPRELLHYADSRHQGRLCVQDGIREIITVLGGITQWNIFRKIDHCEGRKPPHRFRRKR